jgi:branched-chain amino acid transport system ATP-binding protein
MTMLNVNGLHTYYGESHVLQGVTMSVDPGTVTALLGRNGVGKTTLCRSLTGLTPARSGTVQFKGADVTRLPPHRIWERGLGIVPQGRRIFPSLTVIENLAIARRDADLTRSAPHETQVGPALSGPPSTWDIDKVISVFPRLGERTKNRGNELSGGEQQMLAIARALVSNPSLLIMDEPTEGLSPAMVAEVARVIRRLKQEGTTVLLVEQNAAFAVRVADYAHVMSKGIIVHSSAAEALWHNEEIKSQYLGVPKTGH